MSPGYNTMSCMDVSLLPEGGGETYSKSYDYLLKFLLVGDSDVGKHEILQGLEDGSIESPFCVGNGKYIMFFINLKIIYAYFIMCMNLITLI